VARSLFVSASPWGTRVLSGLRDQLRAAHGSLDALPALGWLALDGARREDAGRATSDWRESERVALEWSAADARSGDWWREGAREENRITRALSHAHPSGENTFRAGARSALWRWWPQVNAALRQGLQSVLLAESGFETAKRLGSVDGSLLNIYVVAHLGEAAAGSAFDLAYALRFLSRATLSGETQTARLIGVLGLPPAAAPGEELAVAFAALCELNHWSDSHTLWSAQAQGGAKLRAQEGEAPFDVPTLWAPRNASGYALGSDDSLRAVTQWLALDLQSDLAASRNDDRTRLLSLCRAQDEWEQPSRFFAAGVASLQFPREALSQAVAARLARAAWQEALAPPPARDITQDAAQEAATWLRENEFDARTLLEELDAEPQPGHARRIGDLRAQLEGQWQGNLSNLSVSPPNKAQALADEIFGQLGASVSPRGDADAWNLRSPLPIGEGDTAARVRERFADLEARWREKAGEFVPSRAGDARWRTPGTEALLKAISARLAGSRRELDAASNSVSEELAEARAALQGAFAALSGEELGNHGGFLGRGTRKRQAQVAEGFVELGALVGALCLRQQAIVALRNAFSGSDQVWERPRSELKRFADAVQEGVRLLGSRAQTWENGPPIVGQLVLHRSSPDSLRAAAELYERELAPQIESGRSLGAQEAPVGTLWREALSSLGVAPGQVFGALMTNQGPLLGEALIKAALVRSQEFFRKTAALDLFAALYADENAAGARVQQLFHAADAFFPLSRGSAVPGWNEGELRQLRRAGFHNATTPLRRSDAETHFYGVTKALGFEESDSANDQIVALFDESRALFWSEVGGFPLRAGGPWLRDMESAYSAHERDPKLLPLHARADVGFWLPIEAPSPEMQGRVWRDLLVGLSTGAVVFEAEGDGSTGKFLWREDDGREHFLGRGPNLTRADADSLWPWREVVFRCAGDEERARFGALHQKLLLSPVRGIVEQIAALLGSIESPRLRRHVSEVLGEWKEILLGPKQQKLESQLQKVRSVLDNPAQAHLHANARIRQQQIEDELAFLHGPASPSATLDPAQELERLLSV